ncbi:MAG: sigma 54-interacting transcriptional regulator [Bacteroidota bacterium]
MSNPITETAHRTSGGEFEYPIVGRSRAAEKLREDIRRLAGSRADVIIVGEAGVGKGAVARNLYHLSQGSSPHPFKAINLSVLDDRELESLLFGFDRGAEGLPATSRRGLFEQVNGGTLVIEEIEEASFRNQMKILSFINERTTRRIGGDVPEPVDIRLIVTLKADPRELLERRKLMDDLFARLQEFEKIEVVPLREKPEDIPVLVRHFADEICRELGVGDLIIDINAIDVLVRQPWRENLRELKAVVDKSVLFSNQGRFVLPPELVDEKTEVVKMINNIVAGQEFILDKSLDVIEKGIIERSLEKFGFNQSKAAQFLGMTEQTFRYKLKRLGIASARSRS